MAELGRRVLMACVCWPSWELTLLPQEFLLWLSAPHHCLHCLPQDGQKWEEGPCKVCECQQAQVTCYQPSCPPCPVATLALVVKGQCCPDCTPSKSMSHFFLLRWFSCQENSDRVSSFFPLFSVAQFGGVLSLFNFLDQLYLPLIFTEFVWWQPFNFGQVTGPPSVLVFLIIKCALFILKKNFCISQMLPSLRTCQGLAASYGWKYKSNSTKFARDVISFLFIFLKVNCEADGSFCSSQMRF